ncbi:hypothetical protein KIPB_012182, partial [Kipferlia bialata]|eukprot:g12182.t1
MGGIHCAVWLVAVATVALISTVHASDTGGTFYSVDGIPTISHKYMYTGAMTG